MDVWLHQSDVSNAGHFIERSDLHSTVAPLRYSVSSRYEWCVWSCVLCLCALGITESVDLIGTRRLNRNKYFSILVFRPGSDKAFVTTAIANSHHDHWSYVSIKFSLWWHSHGLKLVSHYRLRNSRKWYDGNQVKFRRSYIELSKTSACDTWTCDCTNQMSFRAGSGIASWDYD